MYGLDEIGQWVKGNVQPLQRGLTIERIDAVYPDEIEYRYISAGDEVNDWVMSQLSTWMKLVDKEVLGFYDEIGVDTFHWVKTYEEELLRTGKHLLNPVLMSKYGKVLSAVRVVGKQAGIGNGPMNTLRLVLQSTRTVG